MSTTSFLTLAQSAGPKAVELIGGVPTVTTTNWSLILWLIISLGATLTLGATLAYRWSRTTPLDQAFSSVALRLHLRRAERRLLRDLAGPDGAPVALLLSEHAFTQAITARERHGTGVDPALVLSLRRRAFG